MSSSFVTVTSNIVCHARDTHFVVDFMQEVKGENSFESVRLVIDLVTVYCRKTYRHL